MSHVDVLKYRGTAQACLMTFGVPHKRYKTGVKIMILSLGFRPKAMLLVRLDPLKSQVGGPLIPILFLSKKIGHPSAPSGILDYANACGLPQYGWNGLIVCVNTP